MGLQNLVGFNGAITGVGTGIKFRTGDGSTNNTSWFTIQNPSGTAAFVVAQNAAFGTTGRVGVGNLTPNSSTDMISVFTVRNDLATTLPTVIIKNIASQTADALQVQNSSGTVLANVTAAGNVGDRHQRPHLPPPQLRQCGRDDILYRRSAQCVRYLINGVGEQGRDGYRKHWSLDGHQRHQHRPRRQRYGRHHQLCRDVQRGECRDSDDEPRFSCRHMEYAFTGDKYGVRSGRCSGGSL